jgi:hypothetical protein
MINNNEIKKRTLRSFIVLVLFFILAFGAWHIVHQSTGEDIPPFFRSVLEMNGKIWSSIYSSERSAGHPEPPPLGKKPRLNGDLGLQSPIDLKVWSLKVGDLKLSMDDIRALPKTYSTVDFKCIEGWSEIISYSGVKFADFVKHYHLPTDMPYVALETPDREYYVSIDMASMMHPQTLLVYEMNGKPLTESHGAPLRLLIPVKYGIKSLKRIGRIYFSKERPPDYWAERGYDWFSGL